MDKRLRNFATPDSIDVPYSDIMEKNYNLFPFTYMEHLPEETNHDSLVQIGSYIDERVEKFDIDSFENPDQECVILSVTKNSIYAGEVLTASELSELNQKYKRVYPGDFTYNPHRINVGSIGIVPNIAPYMFVSNIYPVFRINDQETLPNYYLQRLLKTNI